MKFLFPSFLFALFAIAIPIIIHLFNFRKFKKVYFTNVKFLKEVKQETQSKSKLKHLLVLCSRILAIIFLVLAFARPYIPSENSGALQGDKVVSVFVDNSFSMQAENEEGILFEEAKNKAREIAGAFKPSDKFQLLTNDFEGRHQRIVSKEEFLTLLDEISISPSVRTLPEIILRQQDLLKKQEEPHKLSFVVSDFQKSMADFSEVKSDTSLTIKLISLSTEKAGNVYIDSCYFVSPVRRPGQAEEFVVRVKNASNQAFESIPLKLLINGQQKTQASVNIGPNAEEDIKLVFTVNEPGIHKAVVKITDYPVTYDDDYYFTFKIEESLPILIVNGDKESPYLNGLFLKDEYFNVTQMQEKNSDFSKFSSNSLIILNEIKSLSSGFVQELKKFTENGGSLLIIPTKEIDYESYRSFLSATAGSSFAALDTNDLKVTKINTEHYLFGNVFESVPQNIDLPLASARFVIEKNNRRGEEDLLKLQNGDVFLGRYTFGKGFIYLSSVPFRQEFSNFQKHALFVPVMYNIALFSQSRFPLSYTIGKDKLIENPGTEVKSEIVKLTSSDDFEIIPEQKSLEGKQLLYFHDAVKEAGNFSLKVGDKETGGLSFNFDRKESILEYLTESELTTGIEKFGLSNFSVLAAKYSNTTSLSDEFNLGRRLWKVCIIFALLFLLAEIILLRIFKT
jgi:hypothetical protein